MRLMTSEGERLGAEHRNLALDAQLEEARESWQVLGDHEDRHRQVGDDVESLVPLALAQGAEICGLALTDDLDSPGFDVRVVAGESEPRLLHPGVGDSVVEVRGAAQHREAQPCELFAEELTDLDVSRVAHSRRSPEAGARRIARSLADLRAARSALAHPSFWSW